MSTNLYPKNWHFHCETTVFQDSIFIWNVKKKELNISNNITDCTIPTYRRSWLLRYSCCQSIHQKYKKLSSSTLWIMESVPSRNTSLEWGDRAGNIKAPRACAADTGKLKHFSKGGPLWNHCIMSPDGTKEIFPFLYN